MHLKEALYRVPRNAALSGMESTGYDTRMMNVGRWAGWGWRRRSQDLTYARMRCKCKWPYGQVRSVEAFPFLREAAAYGPRPAPSEVAAASLRLLLLEHLGDGPLVVDVNRLQLINLHHLRLTN